MEYRQLGRTGLALSVVGFGCGRQAHLMIGGDHELRLESIRVALDGGINYFDTADSYGSGQADENLARAFRELDVHPHLVAKVTLEPGELGNPRTATLQRFERCLNRLQRDHVEVLMLHNQLFDQVSDGERGPVGARLSLDHVFGSHGVAAAFAELAASGTVDVLAFTAFGGDTKAMVAAIDSGVFGAFNVTLNLLNPSASVAVPAGFTQQDFARVIETGAARGLGVMAIAVLGQGSLATARGHAGRDQRVVAAVSSAVLGFSGPDQVRTALSAVARGPLGAEAVREIESAAIGEP
jgi:aryl-alcohol dehydrogenase-like predicted oxidoreductase